jgi:nucleotide-binding universal stress UspA family protein
MLDPMDLSSSGRDAVAVSETAETYGPVVACIADGHSGRSVALIADVLARRLGARLLLTTVEQPTPAIATRDAVATALMRRPEPVLSFAAHALEEATDLRVTTGEPAERLLAVAQTEAAQLLVVSAPLPSGAPARRLGNVYLALAGAAPCPVVIVPPRVAGLHDGPIVCGVDGSQSSHGAVDVAAQLAARLERRLLLVAAEDGSDASLAADELAAVAERQAAHLLVIGSRGRGSGLLGSVASRLAVAATRPLVVVPSRSKQCGTERVASARSGHQ